MSAFNECNKTFALKNFVMKLERGRKKSKIIYLFFCRVLYNIMANEYVSNDYKDRLRVAARSGRDDGVCHVRSFP